MSLYTPIVSPLSLLRVLCLRYTKYVATNAYINYKFNK